MHGYHSPPSIQGKWLTIDDQKNNILALLSCQLSSSKLVAKARNETFVYYTEVISVLLCVCVVSQFDLSIRKRNYLFVRCESLSHIPNTSLRCSNQPSWKLSLMTGLNTTKQQKGEIKNAI